VGGVAAGGAVLGLVGSGLLLEWFSWQAVFGLNVVLAIGALAGTILVVPATRESRPPRLDPIGTLLSVFALVTLVFGIIEGPERGWSARSPRPRLRRALPALLPSSSGSCAATSRCSTRATSCAGGSAPVR
jgi:MFS family permease